MIKKIAFGLSCMALVMLAGCQKEESKTPDSGTATVLRAGECSPYRVVLGSALVAELTTLANCLRNEVCIPNTVTTVQSPRFINPADNSFYGFQDGASISTADQLTILQAGQNFASANTPAGYHILRIEFKASYLPSPFTDWFNVYVLVTYRKCL